MTSPYDLAIIGGGSAGQADRPICHVNIGFIKEAGQWAVGSPVEVTEIACRALGDPACRYRVRLGE